MDLLDLLAVQGTLKSLLQHYVSNIKKYICKENKEKNKESWAPKNWCFWTVVLVKTPESPLDCKEIQQIHPKGNQSWIFIGRTDAETETPILWLPDAKNWFIWKDPDAGKDWKHEQKGMTEDEMVGWHHQLDGYGFEWTPGVGDGQGGLACCDSWGRNQLAESLRIGCELGEEMSSRAHGKRL